MNVLLIGSGGREHALAWALLASPLLGKLYCAPGNAGIAEIADCVALEVADHGAVVRFCRDNDIALVVVGPEAPLIAGLADDLEAARIKVFGPSKAAARLEGSRASPRISAPSKASRLRLTRASMIARPPWPTSRASSFPSW
jgi:phosphoribosylamine--glycine ligase